MAVNAAGWRPARIFTFLSRTNELLQNAAKDNVGRALSEMGQDELGTDRRKKLASFLAAAVDQYDQKLDLCRTKAGEAGLSLSGVLEAIEQVQSEDLATAEITDCNISAVVATSVVLARHANGSQIAVEHDDANSSYVVRANRVLLSQIVVNLLTNAAEAIAASGRGDGKISVSERVLDGPDGAMLQVTVTDNGDGFDPALAARLFERGYSTRSSKSGGLGLHWCANTVNAMGGSLSLESKGAGQGATAILRMALVTNSGVATKTGLSLVA